MSKLFWRGISFFIAGFFLLSTAGCGSQKESPHLPVKKESVAPNGNPLLIDTGRVGIEISATSVNPIVANRANCVSMITECLSRFTSDSVMDACIQEIHACVPGITASDVDCCPSLCIDRYTALRGQGRGAIDASQAFGRESGGCFDIWK